VYDPHSTLQFNQLLLLWYLAAAAVDASTAARAHPNTPSLNKPSTSFAWNCKETKQGDPAEENYCPPLIEDISAYQIFLWTSFVLFLILSSAVSCLCNMDVGYDSLLYAKFRADTSGSKTD
jgi:hypothetical protein